MAHGLDQVTNWDCKICVCVLNPETIEVNQSKESKEKFPFLKRTLFGSLRKLLLSQIHLVLGDK